MHFKKIIPWLVAIGLLLWFGRYDLEVVILIGLALTSCIRIAYDAHNLSYFRKKNTAENKLKQKERVCTILILGILGFATLSINFYNFFPKWPGKNAYTDTAGITIGAIVIFFYIFGLLRSYKRQTATSFVSEIEAAPA